MARNSKCKVLYSKLKLKIQNPRLSSQVLNGAVVASHWSVTRGNPAAQRRGFSLLARNDRQHVTRSDF
jgi:hypothetical protein